MLTTVVQVLSFSGIWWRYYINLWHCLGMWPIYTPKWHYIYSIYSMWFITSRWHMICMLSLQLHQQANILILLYSPLHGDIWSVHASVVAFLYMWRWWFLLALDIYSWLHFMSSFVMFYFSCIILFRHWLGLVFMVLFSSIYVLVHSFLCFNSMSQFSFIK